MIEKFRPTAREFYRVEQQASGPDVAVLAINGERNGTSVRGTLTVKLLDGEPDGYDWAGSPISADDEQALLDLFADRDWTADRR